MLMEHLHIIKTILYTVYINKQIWHIKWAAALSEFSSVNLTGSFWDCVRKQEYPEKTRRCAERTAAHFCDKLDGPESIRFSHKR